MGDGLMVGWMVESQAGDAFSSVASIHRATDRIL